MQQDDRVLHDCTSKRHWLDDKNIQIMQTLSYWGDLHATIRVNGEESLAASIKRLVQQGFYLCPTLFKVSAVRRLD